MPPKAKKPKQTKSRHVTKREMGALFMMEVMKPRVDVIMPSVLPPVLYSVIENLCRDALLYSGNQSGMRQSIVTFLTALRACATREFGHETPDIHGLAALLRRTNTDEEVNKGQPKTTDPLKELYRQRHLNDDDMLAATTIRNIWHAWGRYLTMAARSYEGSGGASKSSAPDPVTAMGTLLLNDWHFAYIPWYENAKKILVPRMNGGMINAARLVLHCVTLPAFPGALDKSERLKRGTTLGIVKTELRALAQALEKGRASYGG